MSRIGFQPATGEWRNGRRARFRSVCPKGREGSTPSSPTRRSPGSCFAGGPFSYFLCGGRAPAGPHGAVVASGGAPCFLGCSRPGLRPATSFGGGPFSCLPCGDPRRSQGAVVASGGAPYFLGCSRPGLRPATSFVSCALPGFPCSSGRRAVSERGVSRVLPLFPIVLGFVSYLLGSGGLDR